jgi:hydrogenase maturation protein HypF
MARDLDAVRAFAHLSEAEAALLTSRARPIVLLGRREDAAISPLVAPEQATVGVMLPYTPLHYLLLGERPLVMTSGNLGGEPIAYRNDEAEARLGTLADVFLLHDRDIHVPSDDSVMRIFQGAEVPIRRSRGYAPYPIKLPLRSKPLLAVGGELKNTFCLAHDRHAFMSQHIGDVENLETLDALARAVDHMDALFRIAPQRVICDLHPRYLSSGWAEQYAQRRALPLVRVQHHHAHIAALMAENGLDGGTPVIGLCFDGTGYGTDGAIWGGEVLIADYRGFQRAAHLRYTPLPGGDSAIKHPARIALAHLWAAGIPWMDDLPPVAVCSEVELRIIERELERGFNVVPTSSMGRLFDAAAALAGVRETINYEAQAAMEFEALIDPSVQTAYRFDLTSQAGNAPLLIDPTPLLHELAEDARAGIATGIIAARFHNGVAEIAAQAAARVRAQHRLTTVALSGGVFQNVALLERTIAALRGAGFAHILTHRLVPANDGGIALGQAVIGALRAV